MAARRTTDPRARRHDRRRADRPALARVFVTAAVVAGLVAGCSSESSSDGSTSTMAPSTSAASTTAPSIPSSTTPDTGSSTTVPTGLEQPAIWPAADVVFDEPELAAADFVVHVLDVPVALGEFMAGDSRSGEIEVSCIDCSGTSRGVLFMRMLGPSDGWFVTGIGNDVASFTTPAQGDRVSAGPVLVEGTAMGFEANVSISAYVAGDESRLLDREIVLAGSMGEPGPFSVTLDLSDAEPGETVMLLVRGGVGLETDPGDLGAIAVIVVG